MVVLKHQKGFTLVELMIVVAIIGVLAVTLLPALSGAQERARDGGRTASLNNISAALSTFNSDAGQFPTSVGGSGSSTQETGVARCLSDANGWTADDLAALLKWWKAPLDPQRAAKVGSTVGKSCAVGGVYAYFPLQKGGIDRASFFLAADMETYKKANFDYSGSGMTNTPTGGGDDSTDDVWEDVVEWNLAPLTEEPAKKADSVYVVTN